MSIPANLVIPTWNFPNNWEKFLLQEILLSWYFVAGDVSSAIIPGLLFIWVACTSIGASTNELILALGCGSVYFWLYLWSFCLSNQLDGIDEDRLNKPHRPIIEGLTSPVTTQFRWLIAMFLFTIIGWWLNVLEWAILWEIVILLHNFLGWSKHWVGKNILMSAGILVQLAAAWQIVTPITPIAWKWIFIFAGLIFPLVSVQDLRDIKGDLVNNRKTFPIVFGEMRTRFSLCLCFMVLPIIIHIGLIMPTDHISKVLFDIGLAVISFVIALRIILCRSRPQDHFTYLLFTYWYCIAVASGIAVLK